MYRVLWRLLVMLPILYVVYYLRVTPSAYEVAVKVALLMFEPEGAIEATVLVIQYGLGVWMICRAVEYLADQVIVIVRSVLP
jgi:hypothetical protein